MNRLFLVLIIILYATPLWAGVCTTFVQRVCQPGKSCRTSESHTGLANSASECVSQARQFCTVHLTEEIASKRVRAEFEGKPVEQNICQ